MTAKEKKVIQKQECDLWNERIKNRFEYAVSNIPKGTPYLKVEAILDDMEWSKRESAAWWSIYNLMENLKIEIDYAGHADYSHRLWQYYHNA